MEKYPFLFMFLGVPGSGKSYFARRLAKEINAVRLNGDSMRMALWGSLEEIEKVYAVDRSAGNKMTFGALNYVVEQILTAKQSVVYDTHHNRRSDRSGLEEIAKNSEAIPIIIWIKTPMEIAIKRGQEREPMVDQHVYSEEKLREIIARQMASFDEPAPNENVIMIDGTADFTDQFASFKEQIATFL
jgi:hypothetical protein